MHANADATLVESFLRGLLGDPLGVSDEIRAQAGTLGGRFQAWSDQVADLDRRDHQIDAQLNRLRGELSQRYGQEFSASASH